jgi:tRNA(His) 5'-end guanylyltransferase
MLPRRSYTVLRLDGKGFHGYTKSFDKPFDKELMYCMQETAKYLCQEIQGARIAYTQSDEISIILTDFGDETTQAWFDGNLQKMVSISAAMATAKFNELVYIHAYAKKPDKLAIFDSRVFTIPDRTEVINAIIWRQQDASRNSISMLAQALYSHKELHKKNSSQMQELCFQKGCNWNDLSVHEKRGATVIKIYEQIPEEFIKRHESQPIEPVLRSKWIVDEPPIFTQDRDYLQKHIPQYE